PSARGDGDRADARGGGRVLRMTGVWETIAGEAARESPLWQASLRPAAERELVPVFSPLGAEEFALGLETIYEGYLLHYGRPRLFAPADRSNGLLLGDYLYAHGLVRIAAVDPLRAVGDLAELIPLSLPAPAAGPRSLACGSIGTVPLPFRHTLVRISRLRSWRGAGGGVSRCQTREPDADAPAPLGNSWGSLTAP